MPRKEIDIELAIKLYADYKLPSTYVSKQVGCSVQTLIVRLRENAIQIRTNTDYKAKVDFEIIKNEYESGMSTTDIANKHNMNPVSI